MKLKLTFRLFFVLLLSVSAFSAEFDTTEAPSVNLNFPLIDVPFNSTSYFPNYFSMQQSLAFSTDFYEGVHFLIAKDRANATVRERLQVLGFDLLSFYIPLGSSWLHEEWHRAVLSSHGNGSFNDVNTFPIGRGVLAVSHVDDQDLIALKRDHPADQVRLSSAGMEAQVFQKQVVESHHFFRHQKTPDQILIWANSVNVIFYLDRCASRAADVSTDAQNQEDGADIPKRDFTGLDCDAWVYDLFRPDEPYTQRGIHPSGVGINRYIHFSDLSDKEQKFLIQQKNYSYLNLVDPFLFGKERWQGHLFGSDFNWNLKLAHYLTSFGGTIDAIFFFESSENKFLFTLHNGMTDSRYLPGLSLELLEVHLPWKKLYADFSSTIWVQPRGQRVEESNFETTAAFDSKIHFEINSQIEYYVGIGAKTPGWIAGNVYLERNLSALIGLKSTYY